MTQAADDPGASSKPPQPRIVIVGAGFTGLAAGYELATRNLPATVIEAEPEPGGLAGTFQIGDTRLERFYHHWFTNDRDLMELAAELGLSGSLIMRHARTGMYYANSLFRLSSPLDLLRFTPLSLLGRLRLGMVLPAAKSVRRWQDLDDVTAAVWLRRVCGEEAYRVVWEPLLRGKFGAYAERISAAWFWSKFRLRGSSRGRDGREQLVYCQGGFATVANAMVRRIEAAGGRVITGSPVTALETSGNRIAGVATADAVHPADAVIVTTPLPVAARLLSGHVPSSYCADLARIRFLANRCLVLDLDRPLSDLYCAPGDPFLSLSDEDALAFALPHLRRMFPALEPQMVRKAHSWQAEWAQPLVEVGYGRLIPPHETPLTGAYLATMAQVYPEDRGTNYAIRDGRKVAAMLARALT
jgi:protoporphyrinogen oxidase